MVGDNNNILAIANASIHTITLVSKTDPIHRTIT